MRTIILFSLILSLLNFKAITQNNNRPVNGSSENWTVFNRNVTYSDGVIHLNAQENDGLLWVNAADFKNGIIELDIKGKNEPGRSFVGLAFHGLDNTTFDAVYFRPFNFKNPERHSHSVQYISEPDYGWSKLRNTFPGKYENSINPVPDPDGWFHAKIVVKYPKVSVYVNRSEKASLEIDQISMRKGGMIGIWVGNGSEGWFKNFRITATN